MAVTVRTDLRPGDLGAVISLHGTPYASEQSFDATFEAYVAEALGADAKAAGMLLDVNLRVGT